MHSTHETPPPPESGALAAGTTFGGGRYVITRKLGEGGMGVVYLAEQLPINRAVVIKLIHRHLINDPEMVGRFKREMHITARIEHPNTVRVYDCGEEQGQPYIVTEYVAGVDLANLLAQEGRLPLKRLLTIGEQVARGLRAAHAAGIVHRDLKPANVMVQSRHGDDMVTVLDFGIAKPLGEHAHLKTGAGMLIGTPTYMSPEQCAGTAIDARSDLYALGLLLFEMAAGRPPFTDEAPTALLVAHVSLPPPNLADLVPEVPASLHHLIASLLEKLPERRPASADEVIDRLGAIGKEADRQSGGSPAPALPGTAVLQMPATAQLQTPATAQLPLKQPGPAISPPSKPRRRGLIALAAVAGVALVAVGIAKFSNRGWVTGGRPEPDFTSWESLSAKDEPAFPEECRSDDADVRAALEKNVAIQPPPAETPQVWLQDVQSLPDSSAEKWLLLARHAGAEEDRTTAARKAVDACQSSAVAHNLLGNSLQKQGAFSEAAAQYEQALALGDQYLAPSFNLAVLDIRQGKHEDALARLQGVHGRNPNYPGLAPLLGKLLLAAGRAEEAVQILRPAVDTQGGRGAAGADALWYLLAQALDATRQPTEARAAYCKAKEAGHPEAQSRCR